MKTKLALLFLFLFLNGFAQKKDFGIKEAIRYLALPPSVAADSIKKFGFNSFECIGHPWIDDESGNLCLINEKTQLVVTVSPRLTKRKGCEVLIMGEGPALKSKNDQELAHENFAMLYDDGKNGKAQEHWYKKGLAIYTRSLFVERKYIKTDPEAGRAYFVYVHYDQGRMTPETFTKLAAEPITIPPKRFQWNNASLSLLLPAQANIFVIDLQSDSLHITWPTGDWSGGPFRLGILKTARNTKKLTASDWVFGVMKNTATEQTDSLIYKHDKATGVTLHFVERDGIRGSGAFVATYFAIQKPSGDLVYGEYSSAKHANGERTRSQLRETILATYRELTKERGTAYTTARNTEITSFKPFAANIHSKPAKNQSKQKTAFTQYNWNSGGIILLLPKGAGSAFRENSIEKSLWINLPGRTNNENRFSPEREMTMFFLESSETPEQKVKSKISSLLYGEPIVYQDADPVMGLSLYLAEYVTKVTEYFMYNTVFAFTLGKDKLVIGYYSGPHTDVASTYQKTVRQIAFATFSKIKSQRN